MKAVLEMMVPGGGPAQACPAKPAANHTAATAAQRARRGAAKITPATPRRAAARANLRWLPREEAHPEPFSTGCCMSNVRAFSLDWRWSIRPANPVKRGARPPKRRLASLKMSRTAIMFMKCSVLPFGRCACGAVPSGQSSVHDQSIRTRKYIVVVKPLVNDAMKQATF